MESIVSPAEHKIYNPSDINFLNLDKDIRPNTRTEGLSETIIENKSLMIEETNYGHMFELDFVNNKVLWRYLNSNKNDDIYYLNWSFRTSKIPISFNNNSPKNCKL